MPVPVVAILAGWGTVRRGGLVSQHGAVSGPRPGHLLLEESVPGWSRPAAWQTDADPS